MYLLCLIISLYLVNNLISNETSKYQWFSYSFLIFLKSMSFSVQKISFRIFNIFARGKKNHAYQKIM